MKIGIVGEMRCNMSEEEKKAIEIVKNITTDDLLNYWEGPEEPYNAIKTILKLIEKQQKENEELKNKLDIANKIIAEMVEYIDIEKMDFQCSSLCVRPGCEINCIQEYFRKKVEKC